MDEDTAALISRMAEELSYYVNHEDCFNVDASDAEHLITEAEQLVYKHDCSKYDIVDGRPKPFILKGYI